MYDFYENVIRIKCSTKFEESEKTVFLPLKNKEVSKFFLEDFFKVVERLEKDFEVYVDEMYFEDGYTKTTWCIYPFDKAGKIEK